MLIKLSILSLLILAIPTASWAASFSLAGVANVAKARNLNPTRSYTSDGKLAFGAALLVEGEPLATNRVLTTELGLVYVQRKTGYGTLYTEESTWFELPLLERLHIMNFSLGAGLYLAKATGDVKRIYSAQTNIYSYDDLAAARSTTARCWRWGMS